MQSFNELVKTTIIPQAQSVMGQIEKITYVGFEPCMTSRGAIKSDKRMQYVYRIHVLDKPTDEIGLNTGKKVGRCKTMNSRVGLYRQLFKAGVPDRCQFTTKLIKCLQDNPTKKVSLVFECLEWNKAEIVKAECETYWKHKSIEQGYDLMA